MLCEHYWYPICQDEPRKWCCKCGALTDDDGEHVEAPSLLLRIQDRARALEESLRSAREALPKSQYREMARIDAALAGAASEEKAK